MLSLARGAGAKRVAPLAELRAARPPHAGGVTGKVPSLRLSLPPSLPACLPTSPLATRKARVGCGAHTAGSRWRQGRAVELEALQGRVRALEAEEAKERHTMMLVSHQPTGA